MSSRSSVFLVRCSVLLLILLLLLLSLLLVLVLILTGLLFAVLLGFVLVLVVLRLGVDGLADLHGGVLQSLKSLCDLVTVLGNDGLVEGGDVTADLVLNGLGDSGGVFLQLLLGVVDVVVGLVLKVNNLLEGLIRLLGSFGFLHHSVDVGVGETTAGLDLHVLGLASGLVFGRDVHDTVGIDIEGDLNLGVSTGGHGDSLELEVPELLVVLGELTLSLKDGDSDLGLVVSGGGEDLGFLGGDGSVSVDQTGEDTSHGLNTEGKGGHIEEEHVLDVTGEDGALDGSTDSNSLIGVDTSVGLLAEEVLDSLADLGHTGGATNEENLVDLVLGQTGVLEAVLEGLEGAADEGVNKTFHLGSGKLEVQMLGARVVEGEVRDGDGGLSGGGKLNLSLLGSLANTLDGSLVSCDVDAGLALEFSGEELLELDIEIFSAEGSVTVSGLDFENTSGDLEDGDIEGTTTEIVDSDDLAVGLVESESEGGSGGLVNDSLDIEVGDLASILGGLSLGVVEVSGDGNDGILDGGSEVSLSGFLHLGENEGTDLGGRVLLTAGLNPGVTVGSIDDLVGQMLHIGLSVFISKLASDQSLGREKSIFRILHGLYIILRIEV